MTYVTWAYCWSMRWVGLLRSIAPYDPYRDGVGRLVFGKPCDMLRAVLPSAGMAGANIARGKHAIIAAGGDMLRKLILIAGVAAAASPAAIATAHADELPGVLSARAVVAVTQAGQQRGACGSGSPCAAVNCGPGRVCVPSPKQCITTPCPQYECVPASSVSSSSRRPSCLRSRPDWWRCPRREQRRLSYSYDGQAVDSVRTLPASASGALGNGGRVSGLRP